MKKRALSLWMKPEMISRLDTLKESRGISTRNDMIRMLIETHPDYREPAS